MEVTYPRFGATDKDIAAAVADYEKTFGVAPPGEGLGVARYMAVLSALDADEPATGQDVDEWTVALSRK